MRVKIRTAVTNEPQYDVQLTKSRSRTTAPAARARAHMFALVALLLVSAFAADFRIIMSKLDEREKEEGRERKKQRKRGNERERKRETKRKKEGD